MHGRMLSAVRRPYNFLASPRVTFTERQDLEAVALLLAIDSSVLEATLYSAGESLGLTGLEAFGVSAARRKSTMTS
jgi:hypothetical protein